MVWLCQQKSYFWGLIDDLTKGMKKKLAGILLLTGIFFTAFSQNEENKRSFSRPDIPGTFTLELGLNRGLEAPEDFKLGLWGSRTINVYYSYNFRILNSRFSFVPGIGLSLERFKFRSGHILGYAGTGRDSVRLYGVSETNTAYPGLRKTQLVTNYIDVPLEIRYSTKPDDPARSFKISVGGRIGYMYDAFNKIKYKQDGEVKQIKDKQFHNLNRFRYGLMAKVGVGNLSLFGYYNISPLFKEGKGFYENGVANDFATTTIGI